MLCTTIHKIFSHVSFKVSLLPTENYQAIRLPVCTPVLETPANDLRANCELRKRKHLLEEIRQLF